VLLCSVAMILKMHYALLVLVLCSITYVHSVTPRRAAHTNTLPERETHRNNPNPGAAAAEVLAGDEESLAKLEERRAAEAFIDLNELAVEVALDDEVLEAMEFEDDDSEALAKVQATVRAKEVERLAIVEKTRIKEKLRVEAEKRAASETVEKKLAEEGLEVLTNRVPRVPEPRIVSGTHAEETKTTSRSSVTTAHSIEAQIAAEIAESQAKKAGEVERQKALNGVPTSETRANTSPKKTP
jgi:hypothetical protein